MTRYRILRDTASILSCSDELLRLAQRTGQHGAMNWLVYFLDESKLKRKRPVLVLAEHATPGQGNQLWGAATYVEYTAFHLSTGLLCTDDSVAFRSFIAPEENRAEFAARASQLLLQEGASVVLSTVEASIHDVEREVSLLSGIVYACTERKVGRFLPLAESLNETLASFGKSTRFNLRYYRRRMERELHCAFDEDAIHKLSLEEMHCLNRASMNPVSSSEVDLRFQMMRSDSSSYCMGLRTADGAWLSLVGGWRQRDRSVLHWQLNVSGFEKRSIGTVMRSYFLEHEIGLKMKSLLIYGGTPHSMHHAFTNDTITTLVLRNRSLRAHALLAAGRVVRRFGHAPGQINFLASMLGDPELPWKSANE